MIIYNWNNPVFADRNEMVFEDRNTAYGAYQIRKEYNRSIISAFLISTGMFVGVLMALWLPAVFSSHEDETIQSIIDIDNIAPLDDHKDDPKVDPPKIDPPKEQLIKTVAFIPPVVKNSADADTTLVLNQDDAQNNNIGDHTHDGLEDDVFIVPDHTVTVVEEHNDKVFVYVEEMPEYPGGTEALYKYLSQNLIYPEGAKDNQIEGKCYARFVVTESGKIGKIEIPGGVKGCPECDAEVVRVIKMLPDFKPGKTNGTAVSVWFQLPVTFKLSSR